MDILSDYLDDTYNFNGMIYHTLLTGELISGHHLPVLSGERVSEHPIRMEGQSGDRYGLKNHLYLEDYFPVDLDYPVINGGRSME